MLSDHFRAEPFWWQKAPLAESSTSKTTRLPNNIDVMVVGSGYTGLHAALQTTRAGFSTLVVDAEALGNGCSSRNGGQVSTSLKGDYKELVRRYGPDQALAMIREGILAVDFLEQFIKEEEIDCDWRRSGHFSGAHNRAAYDTTARRLSNLPIELGLEWQMISAEDQHLEIGSNRYHGGVLYPQHASLQPALYHSGLLNSVRSAGTKTVGHCKVERIEPLSSGFNVHTSLGTVRASKVAIATNGYTGPLNVWQRRRIIPIGSYMIATEPVTESVAHEISPRGRTMTDTRRLVFYYRMYEGRMIFGGRVALSETDPRVSAPRLHKAMSEIFPQLANTPIDFSWVGFVGFTFDNLPHIGEKDGIHYSMGYCGSGVSLSSYLGSIMGKQIAGDQSQRSAFMDLNFPTRPYYFGNPWFLKPSILCYRLRDRFNF